MKSRILALLLAVVMLLSLLPMGAFAAEDQNPDADYDGITDSIDPNPGSNLFSGRYTSGNYKADISYTMDYRNFFGDNMVYNADIASFSIWAAQFTYENEDGDTVYAPAQSLKDSDGSAITQVTHIDQLMRAHGMENVIDYSLSEGYFEGPISLGAYSDDDISEVFFGHRQVSWEGQTIELVAVFVRGTNGTIEEWSSNFHIGNLNRFGQEYDAAEGKLRFLNGDWTRKANHRGFDVTQTRVRKALDAYLNTFVDPEVTPVFWITGHSRGGAISNILASYLVDEGEKVFAYTYASPNTTANAEASAAKYDCIFNLVNGDDFVPRLPMPAWGFTRYGRSCRIFASSTDCKNVRSTVLGSSSYNYNEDSKLQELVDKFVAMTKNNDGSNDGWRDVYVYHCGHQHADEVTGEYQSNTIRTRQWSELIGWGESMFTGWSQRIQRYAYWSSEKNGICETPAYAMQTLAELMGNLSLGGAMDYLTTNKLASKFDFGKTSLVGYATGIIDPHYPENYYLIQYVLISQGNPDQRFTTAESLYTNESGRPVHVHDYTFYPYEGQEPSCTAEGRGYKVCLCSQSDPSFYDDIAYDVTVPALGHNFQAAETVPPTCTEEGYTVYRCTRCDAEDLDDITEALGHDFSVEPDPSDELYYLAPSCTEEGLKYLKCSRCEAHSDVGVLIPAKGHSPAEAVRENETAPSCTAPGAYDEVVYCADCGTELSRETRSVEALPHSPGEAQTENLVEATATTDGSYDQVVYCTVCGAELSRETIVIPATGETGPIEISDLEIRNNISLGAEFIINYRLVNNAAFKAYGFDSFWFEFIRHNLDGSTTTTLYGEGKDEALVANGSRSFDLKNGSVPAAEMGVTYEVIFHGLVGDQEYYTAPMTGSLKSFFVSQLERIQPEDDDGEARLRLAADSLLYGAKAQAKFNPDQGELLADLSESAQARLDQYGTQEVPAAEDQIRYSDDGLVNPTIRLSLQNRLEITVRYTNRSAATPVVVEFWPEGNEAAKLSLPATLKSSTWSAVISQIGAAGVRDLYRFRVLANGVPVTNEAVWSVESYVAATRSSTDDAAMVDVLNAVLNFGDSVVNCFN